MFGKDFSEEERHRMSIISREKWTKEYREAYSKKWSGENSPKYGSIVSQDIRDRISKSLMKLSQSDQDLIKKEYTGKRGEKALLSRKYNTSIDSITRLVGPSFKHKDKK